MLETLITQLKEEFEELDFIKEVYEYPTQNTPTSYPALVFYPQFIENTFETNAENFKIYNFKMFLTINAGNKNISDIYGGILPKVFDKLSNHIDENWNKGTQNGHRVWARLSANDFGLSVEEKSKTAWVEMTLQIKTLNTI